MNPTLTPEDWAALRKLLERVAARQDQLGCDAAHLLPKLAHRERALEIRRSASVARNGESATARWKRIVREVRERDGECAVPGFLGIECDGTPEVDHAFGRGKAPEETELCWRLCSRHHFHKTRWNPTRVAWLKRFADHASHYDYGEALARVAKAIALEAGQHPGRTVEEIEEP